MAQAADPNDPVVFRVRVDHGEPPTGAVVVEGESAETRFQGWIELMAAITAGRSRRKRKPGSRTPRLPLAVAALVVAATLGGTQPAVAGQPDRGLAEIMSPQHALQLDGTVTVRVRVRPGAHLRARADGGLVSGRFGRARNGVRMATLRLGKELSRGLNHISIRTTAGGRADFDSVSVVMARRDRSFLSVRGAPRKATHRTPVFRAHWRNEPRHFGARLNGHEVHRQFLTGAGTVKPARLGPEDGLRFGRNRLVLSAHDDEGRYDREVRTFRVSRKAPLVATGPDRRVTTGTPLRLDARKSRAARGGKLGYRWTIVRRPRGSKAKLRRAWGARPTLVPDVRGRYRLRLKVIEERKGKRRGARASQLLPLTGSSTVEVLSPALAGPLGYPISTIQPSGTQGIEVAGTLYPMNSNWVQVLLLDRTTLEPKDPPSPFVAGPGHTGTGQFEYSTSTYPPELVNLVTPSQSGIDASYLVIMTGGGRLQDLGSSQWQALTSAYGLLGGTMAPFNNNGKGQSDPGFGSGQWSLIGVPGLSAGAAAQNWQLKPSSNQAPGSLDGQVMLDSQGNYTFAAGQYIPFDTNVTGQSATGGGTNTMAIGEQTVSSSPIEGNSSGFHMVIVDSGTLEVVENNTYITNTGSGQDASQVINMADLISYYVNRNIDVVFLIQSIGAPNPLDQTWTGPGQGRRALAAAIEAIGGTEFVFNLLPPAGDEKFGYALVGGTGMPKEQAAENGLNPENPSLVPPPARVRGLLKRNRQFQFHPSTWSSFDNSTFGGFDLSALPLAFEPDADTWPTHDTPQHRAAEDYVARQVFYPDLPPTQSGYDLHTYYWFAPWQQQSSTYSSALEDVCPQGGQPTPPPDANFTAADLQFVCEKVHVEFTWVEAVWGLAAELQSSFLQQEITGPSSASAVADAIMNALESQKPNEENEILGDVLLIEGTLLEAVSEVMFAGGGEEGLGPAAGLGAMSGFLDMASDLADAPSGQPQLTTFETEAKNIGYAIQAQYRGAISATNLLSQLLVSDYAKLSTAGPKAQDPQTWGLGQTRLTQFENSLHLSTTRYIWTKLLPGAFNVYTLGFGGQEWLQQFPGTWFPDTYSCYNNGSNIPSGPIIRPWRGAPDSGWQDQTGTIYNGQPYRVPMVLGSNKVGFAGYGNHAINGYPGGPAPSSITDQLVAPVTAAQFSDPSQTLLTQLGLNKPELFSGSTGIFNPVWVAC